MATIVDPCCITSRLMPGARIGNAELSIGYSRRPGDDGRTRYQWHVDVAADEYGGQAAEFSGDDLQSGCIGGSLQSGLESLATFLSAAGEAYRYSMHTRQRSENLDMFPDALNEWAYIHSDELSMLALELESEEGIIAE